MLRNGGWNDKYFSQTLVKSFNGVLIFLRVRNTHGGNGKKIQFTKTESIARKGIKKLVKRLKANKFELRDYGITSLYDISSF